MKSFYFVALVLSTVALQAQSPFFDQLPVGQYDVGFKVITIRDESRVTAPAYNYFGEKSKDDLTKKITIHLWYPAKAGSKGQRLSYGDYCFSERLETTDQELAPALKAAAINAHRENFQGFFGKISDDDWKKLTSANCLAYKDLAFLRKKFPLLIGMLRPVSTTITNEMLASNGYVVAMVRSAGVSYPLGYIEDVRDMQLALAHIIRMGITDENAIGTFGFSGSGFSQVLFAMHDPRIMALADLESGLYLPDLFKILSSSNFYGDRRLKVPFLHLYGVDASKGETSIGEFEKTKFSERYRVIFNQRGLHHWDFAAEGRASTSVLHVRGNKEPGIRATFELANHSLLRFFNAILKKDLEAISSLRKKEGFLSYQDSLLSITYYPAIPPPPDKNEFTEMIKREGIEHALATARKIHERDSLAEFLHENMINLMAREFRREGKVDEGLALMKFSVEMHPGKAWLWSNLSSMQEDMGNIAEAIRCSEKVLELLSDYEGPELSFDSRIKRYSAERLKRLKAL